MMSTEDIIRVKTTVLKVNIHCNGCERRIKKILHKIDGVYQTRIDAQQGKVTVSGLVDADTIIKTLNKVRKPAMLWSSNPDVVSQLQMLQLGGGGPSKPVDASDNGQAKDTHGIGRNGRPAVGVGKSLDVLVVGAGISVGEGSSKDTKIVMPQQMPQQFQQLQQQIQHQQIRGMKIPQLIDGKMSSPAAASTAAQANDPRTVKFNLPEDELDDEGSEFDHEIDELAEDVALEATEGGERKMMMMASSRPSRSIAGRANNGGMKCGTVNEIPMQITGNTSNAGLAKKDIGIKQSLGGIGAHEKNKSSGQPLQNVNSGAMGGGNQHGPRNQGGNRPMIGSGVVGGPMGGMRPPQLGMMRPSNPNMKGSAGFPHTGQMGGRLINMPIGRPHMGMAQRGSAVNGMPADGLPGAGYQGGNDGGGSSMPARPEMVRNVTAPNNPMSQQEHMTMMHHLHQPQQMMGNGHNGGYQGHGGAGYPPMGSKYGHHHPPMQYPMSYSKNDEASYNIFSDENVNSSCSVM